MDVDESDEFAPGALFRRYGQEKNASNVPKNDNVSNKKPDSPKKNGSSETHNAAGSVVSEIKKTAPEPSTSLLLQAVNNKQTVEPEGKKPTSTPIVRTINTHALLVNPKQRGNPVLKSICNVSWEYNDGIAPDYVMGATTCALFLSIRYHNLNPDYIHDRLKLLGNQYELRVLLVQVDTGDPQHALKHLTRICILANLTLVLAWSPEEAGRILEVYKSFEHKPPDLIMERKESDPHQKIVNSLTSIRSVNKTDAATLLSTFGSLESLIRSSRDSVSLCPGLGPQKANRLYNVLHQPFLKSAGASRGTKRKSGTG